MSATNLITIPLKYGSRRRNPCYIEFLQTSKSEYPDGKHMNMKGALYGLEALIRKTVRPGRVFDYYYGQTSKPRGRVLLSYLQGPLRWKSSDKRFMGHSNTWECREIARIFNELGYAVDAINYDDLTFQSTRIYDAIFDIHNNLSRYDNGHAVKILHATGSNPTFSNRALAKRLDDLEKRRGVKLEPRRAIQEDSIRVFEANLEVADIITITGNERTKSTYPEKLHDKIRLVPVTGSYLPVVRSIPDFVPKKEFLWFGGSGAVHKGLDIVLEVFAKNPDLTLHIIGPYQNEKDFCRAYKRELSHYGNMKAHGYVYPHSDQFRCITKHVIALVFPSCSESTSSAGVTCMQYGMIPIVSIDTGITLTQYQGITLNSCTLDEVEQAVHTIANKTELEIKGTIAECQKYALDTFSRNRFSEMMKSVIREALYG